MARAPSQQGLSPLPHPIAKRSVPLGADRFIVLLELVNCYSTSLAEGLSLFGTASLYLCACSHNTEDKAMTNQQDNKQKMSISVALNKILEQCEIYQRLGKLRWDPSTGIDDSSGWFETLRSYFRSQTKEYCDYLILQLDISLDAVITLSLMYRAILSKRKNSKYTYYLGYRPYYRWWREDKSDKELLEKGYIYKCPSWEKYAMSPLALDAIEKNRAYDPLKLNNLNLKTILAEAQRLMDFVKKGWITKPEMSERLASLVEQNTHLGFCWWLGSLELEGYELIYALMMAVNYIEKPLENAMQKPSLELEGFAKSEELSDFNIALKTGKHPLLQEGILTHYGEPAKAGAIAKYCLSPEWKQIIELSIKEEEAPSLED